jgi:hypothetical protein
MDGLELGVCERGLRHGGQGVIVAERTEIVEESGDEFWGWRNEIGGARVVVASSYPVLLRADPPGMISQSGPAEQSGVESEEMIDSDGNPGSDGADCGRHRIDVGQDLTRGHVGRWLPELLRNFGSEEAPGTDLQSLDAR